MAGSQRVGCAASSVAIKAKQTGTVIKLSIGTAQAELRGKKVPLGKGIFLGSHRELLLLTVVCA